MESSRNIRRIKIPSGVDTSVERVGAGTPVMLREQVKIIKPPEWVDRLRRLAQTSILLVSRPEVFDESDY